MAIRGKKYDINVEVENYLAKGKRINKLPPQKSSDGLKLKKGADEDFFKAFSEFFAGSEFGTEKWLKNG